MAVTTAAGTVISISPEGPATYDSTGYAGSGMNWVVIGEITDAGVHGRKYAEITHKPIGSRGVQKFKGSFDEGTKTIQMAMDRTDAGQVIAKAASLSDSDYSFKVQYPPAPGQTIGPVDYFRAKVMTLETSAPNVDSLVNATMQLSLTTNSAGVGVVAVAGS